ncbi:MAG: CoA-binding protein [Bdellovibrionales bacterium]
MSKTVAILGASPDTERFANKAMKKLEAFGHKTVLVNPAYQEIDSRQVHSSLSDIHQPIDTLTMYVGPQISSTMIEEILDLRPQRVIFNPGSESPSVIKALEENRINYVKACTLVMLDTGAF